MSVRTVCALVLSSLVLSCCDSGRMFRVSCVWRGLSMRCLLSVVCVVLCCVLCVCVCVCARLFGSVSLFGYVVGLFVWVCLGLCGLVCVGEGEGVYCG